MRVTQPFDFAQGRESFDFAQDREPVERPAERQMGVFRQPQYYNKKGRDIISLPLMCSPPNESLGPEASFNQIFVPRYSSE